jgi:predicted metal-dependent phosphoesterase TrpH
MSQVDLHIHSTASDGRLSPAELVATAAEHGLTTIALTDHDTIGGLAQAVVAAESLPGFRMIPGIELSTEAEGEVHVLGYFIDYTSDALGARLERMRNSRLERAQAMIGRLADLGIVIEWSRVKEIAGSGSVGRPHLAQAMLEKGYIDSFKDAFTRYIGYGGPAYVERKKVTPVRAVEIVLEAGGLPVLAHPFTGSATEALIIELKAAGLVGIEAYYNNYTADQISDLVSLAREHNLIATGGSDFHGIDQSETAIGGVEVPLEAAEQLVALMEQRVAT